MHNFEDLKIYNGTNHNVIIYDEQDVIRGRDEKFLLKNENCIPLKIISQSKSLSARSNYMRIGDSNYTYFPKGYGSQIDTLANFSNYDIIIVSSKYAHSTNKPDILTNIYYTDFLDRLYVPITVYFQDKIIGCIGFSKVYYPKHPQQYSLDINNRQRPSLSALKACVTMYRSLGYSLDFYTEQWLQTIEYYLSPIYA